MSCFDGFIFYIFLSFSEDRKDSVDMTTVLWR
jgi:hypothetical protein